jgi:hypothetical protein
MLRTVGTSGGLRAGSFNAALLEEPAVDVAS